MLRYTSFLMQGLRIGPPKQLEAFQPIVTLLHRGGTRQILNEADLLAQLRSDFPSALFQSHSMGELSLQRQVETIRSSAVMLGMHGAGLANAIFLRPGAALFELFPFGVRRPIYEFIVSRLMSVPPRSLL